MKVDSAISNAWRDAAADLGIRVVAPFESTMPDGHRMHAEAHVLDFGSPSGAFALSDENPLSKRHSEIKQWCSILFPTYRNYDRTLFIETLNDWGWFGLGHPPEWYSGKPWLPPP